MRVIVWCVRLGHGVVIFFFIELNMRVASLFSDEHNMKMTNDIISVERSARAGHAVAYSFTTVQVDTIFRRLGLIFEGLLREGELSAILDVTDDYFRLKVMREIQRNQVPIIKLEMKTHLHQWLECLKNYVVKGEPAFLLQKPKIHGWHAHLADQIVKHGLHRDVTGDKYEGGHQNPKNSVEVMNRHQLLRDTVVKVNCLFSFMTHVEQ